MTSLLLRFTCVMLTIALASTSMVRAGAQAGAPVNGISPSEAKAGWRSLFDGKTLNGWTSIGELKWTVVDGAMVGDALSQPAAKPLPAPASNPGQPVTWATGFLRTVETFGDFELTAEF